MAIISKLMLSASPDGDGIRVGTLAPIDGTDTAIHTAGAGTIDKDLVTLWAYNKHTAAVELQLQWGDSTDPVILSVPHKSGLFLVVADFPISDGNVISASAGTVDVVTLYGSVNRIDA